MTGDECREARERMNWTRHELATAANVPLWFIAAFEDGRPTPDFLAGYEVGLCVALESGDVDETRGRKGAGRC
jgi:DNA-binding XRE family transcriptional regulator